MQKAAALKILQQLADGIDPHTGQIFGADSPYQHPDTVRALFLALRELGGARPGAIAALGDAPDDDVPVGDYAQRPFALCCCIDDHQ